MKNKNLAQKLLDIRKKIAAPAVIFTVGVTKNGDVDILDVKAIHLPEPVQATEEQITEKSDKASYIG